MATSAFNSFKELMRSCELFGRWNLIVKEFSPLNYSITSTDWEKARHRFTHYVTRDKSNSDEYATVDSHVMLQDKFLALDFRTPKPTLRLAFGGHLLAEKVEDGTSYGYHDSSIVQRVSYPPKVLPTFEYEQLIVKLAANKRNGAAKPHIDGASKKISVNLAATKNDGGGGAVQSQAVHPSFTKNNKSGIVKRSSPHDAIDCQVTPKSPASGSKGDGSGKANPNRKRKSKEITQESKAAEARGKLEVDKDGLLAKVTMYHKRGELRLLTVPDLKLFLSTKKAKVGGTKADLIQRITSMLD